MPPIHRLLSRSDRRDAFRLGLQSAIAATVFYAVMRALGLPEVFVGLLSAILILSKSSDGSIGLGVDRVTATAFGSAVGLVCLFALPYGWGTITALIITMFVINAVSVLRPGWRYGVVAAVALSLGAEVNAVQVTLDRGISILLGVAVGIVVSLIVWPERAATRYIRHRRDALRALRDRLDRVSAASEKSIDPVSTRADRNYHEAYERAVDASQSRRLGGATNSDAELRHLRRVYNSILLVDRALEDGWNAGSDAHGVLDRTRDAIDAAVDGRNPELPETEAIALDTASNSSPHQVDRKAALAFGLKELVSELHALSNAMHRGAGEVT